MVNIDWTVYLRAAKHPLGRFVGRTVLKGERLDKFEALDDTIVVHDLHKGIPASDRSVDAVYHSHVLEHLDRENVTGFFAEIYRVLRPKGIHRIVCPDLEWLSQQYLASLAAEALDHEDRIDALIGQAVRREAHGTSLQSPVRRKVENLLLGDARRRGETHQWMWDRLSLRRALEEAGFRSPAQLSPTTSNIPNWPVFDLDRTQDGNEYKLGSLYMEAIR